MADRSSWEQFFDAHAPIYDDNAFTKNTLAEVDFLLEVLDLDEYEIMMIARKLAE